MDKGYQIDFLREEFQIKAFLVEINNQVNQEFQADLCSLQGL